MLYKNIGSVFLSLLISVSVISQNVGIGTNNPHPDALLHVSLDTSTSKGILVDGIFNTDGTVPNLGRSSRLMYYPAKAAFRAGAVDRTEWDDKNVGHHSIALGNNTIASGYWSSSIGYRTVASGRSALALGESCTASGEYCLASGYLTRAEGRFTFAGGYKCVATGWGSLAFGYENQAANHSVALGYQCNTTGLYALAMGYRSTAGYSATAIGYEDTATGIHSTVFGLRNKALGTSSFTIGGYNASWREYSLATGLQSIAAAPVSLTAGNGTRANGYSSTVVGMFNDPILPDYEIFVSTQTPLFIVGNGNDAISRSNAFLVRKDGHVGIGTNVPAAKIDIAGNNSWDLTNTEGDLRIGNSTHRLKIGVALAGGGAGGAGIMQYGTPGGYNALALGSQGNTIMNLMGNTARVGIGTNNPQQKLDVDGSIRQKTFWQTVSVAPNNGINFIWTHNFNYQPVIMISLDQTSGGFMDYVSVSYQHINNNQTQIFLTNRNSVNSASGTVRWIVVQ